MIPRSLLLALAAILLAGATMSQLSNLFANTPHSSVEPIGAAAPWIAIGFLWVQLGRHYGASVALLWELPSALFRRTLVVGTAAIIAIQVIRIGARLLSTGVLPGAAETTLYDLGVIALASLAAFGSSRSLLRPIVAATRPPLGARDIPLRTRYVVATGGSAFATAGILLHVLGDFETTAPAVLALDLLMAVLCVVFAVAIGWVVGDDQARNIEAVTARVRQLATDPEHTSALVTADEVGDLALAAEDVERRVRSDEARAASTAERERIARELHDGVAKSVSVLSIEAAALAARAPAELRPQIARVERLAALLSEELRAIVRDVRTRGEMEPFVQALERAVAGHANASLSVNGDADALEPLARFEVLRILDEALRNADQHAGAAHVDARLDVRPDDVRLCVEDDGKGIEAVGWAALASAGHFGLLGMRERAELLDGDLRVERRTEGGTRVAVRIPRAKA